MREHVCHPNLLWRDAAVELSEPEFWMRYSVARIASESYMLDIRNTALGVRESHEVDKTSPSQLSYSPKLEVEGSVKSVAPPKRVVSLADMINTSLVLKSNLDVEVTKPNSQWPKLFLASTSAPQTSLLVGQTEEAIPPHVVQAVSSLQREALLLRNELNFEQWLSRENAKHIGRLYQDRMLIKNAEAERQGLVSPKPNFDLLPY